MFYVKKFFNYRNGIRKRVDKWLKEHKMYDN